jgi:hypothetical protein
MLSIVRKEAQAARGFGLGRYVDSVNPNPDKPELKIED